MNTALTIIILAIAAINIFMAGKDCADARGFKEIALSLLINLTFGFIFILVPVIGFIYRNSLGRLVALIGWSDFGFWLKIKVFKMYRNKDKINFEHLEKLRALPLAKKKANKRSYIWYKSKMVKLIDHIFAMHNYTSEPLTYSEEGIPSKTIFNK